MLIVRVLGGLGNQLYQYALSEALRAQGKEVKLDVSAYFPGGREKENRRLELSMFPFLNYEEASLKEIDRFLDRSRFPLSRLRRRIFGSRERVFEEPESFSEEVFEKEDLYLEGFWQNEAYFSRILPSLRKQLTFPWQGLYYANEYYRDRMRKENSVGLHIRRTDYIDESHSFRYGGICTTAYYRAALKECGEAECYYLFTDDPAWVFTHVHDILPEHAKYVLCDWNHGENSFYDLLLMASCRAMICANSSFSCWGARLGTRADKLMIRPFQMDNTLEIPASVQHREWKDWILIDREGTRR